MTKLRRMGWAECVACMGDMRNAFKVLVRKSKGKNHVRELCIDKRILKCHKLTGCDDVYWIHLAQDRGQWQDLVSMVIVGIICFLKLDGHRP
jgi:hypothetical protein